MSEMFKNCDLNNINLSNFDFRKVENMSYCFSRCHNITINEKSLINSSNCLNMDGIFCGTDLTNINTSYIDTRNVKSMNHFFEDCHHLTSNHLKDLNTKNVTSMNYMFSKCRLTNLNFSLLFTKNVTSMVGMFSHCSSSNKIDVFNFDTSNVVTMLYMFEESLLTEIDISSFNIQNLKNISMLFFHCRK